MTVQPVPYVSSVETNTRTMINTINVLDFRIVGQKHVCRTIQEKYNMSL